MIQGCASGVGKSLITAALCHIFRTDGWRVAPFKAQNMGSESFITPDGKEICAVQASQAQAAGVAPSPDMNPIFQKPVTDTVAEVIVRGESIGTMTAKEYLHFKQAKGKVIVAESLDQLRQEFEVIILEGAGSPAEVNLREHDLVNMTAAALADAPVILVGDIDQGGVFAYIQGTMLLLTEEERVRVKGVLINKFRGDRALLEPGLSMLEERIARPILGVIPHINDISIPLAAETIRRSISMEEIYRIVGLSPRTLAPNLGFECS